MMLPVPSRSLQSYLVEINRFPLLTPEEEFELAVRYRKYNDIEAAHRLVTSNLRFVVKIAMEFKGYLDKHTEHAVKLSDLIQEGNIGLMKAVKRFDPYKGYRLITYAVWWIKAQIQQFIIKTISIVKRGTRELRDTLFSQLAKSKEMIERLEKKALPGHPEREVYGGPSPMDGLNEIHHLSLDRHVDEEGETTFLDSLADPSQDQEELVGTREEKILVRKGLKKAFLNLTPKERYVIASRFLVDNPLTLQEIGDKLGITRERVRQLEARGLEKLRKALSRTNLTPSVLG